MDGLTIFVLYDSKRLIKFLTEMNTRESRLGTFFYLESGSSPHAYSISMFLFVLFSDNKRDQFS